MVILSADNLKRLSETCTEKCIPVVHFRNCMYYCRFGGESDENEFGGGIHHRACAQRCWSEDKISFQYPNAFIGRFVIESEGIVSENAIPDDSDSSEDDQTDAKLMLRKIILDKEYNHDRPGDLPVSRGLKVTYKRFHKPFIALIVSCILVSCVLITGAIFVCLYCRKRRRMERMEAPAYHKLYSDEGNEYISTPVEPTENLIED
ncbi:hypothetical protein ACOME3_006882 [Neoechinorhynchus agilis]